MALNRVVLPAPLGPMIPWNVPSSTWMLKFDKIVLPLIVMVMSWTSTTWSTIVLISLYLGVGRQVGTPHHQWSGSLRE